MIWNLLWLITHTHTTQCHPWSAYCQHPVRHSSPWTREGEREKEHTIYQFISIWLAHLIRDCFINLSTLFVISIPSLSPACLLIRCERTNKQKWDNVNHPTTEQTDFNHWLSGGVWSLALSMIYLVMIVLRVSHSFNFSRIFVFLERFQLAYQVSWRLEGRERERTFTILGISPRDSP